VVSGSDVVGSAVVRGAVVAGAGAGAGTGTGAGCSVPVVVDGAAPGSAGLIVRYRPKIPTNSSARTTVEVRARPRCDGIRAKGPDRAGGVLTG
jgi:hypothetical protein